MTPYVHYDVFTTRPFEGNQLAVFPDARALTTEQMQTITREMNFSECTFLLPAETPGTDIRMRIFTPGGELPMAGHPTIGTTFALADSGLIRAGAERVVFGLGIGPTPVELTWAGPRLDFAWMDQKPPVFRDAAASPEQVRRAVGLEAGALADGLPIQEISCGVPFLYVPLRSRADVDRAEPDVPALRALPMAFPDSHRAVFLFAPEPPGSDLSAYSRMFAPDLGVPEDPATGAASGPLGCYLVRHGLAPASAWRDMVSLQGARMRRPSRIHIRVTARTPSAITRVQVGGRAVRVGSGTIDVV